MVRALLRVPLFTTACERVTVRCALIHLDVMKVWHGYLFESREQFADGLLMGHYRLMPRLRCIMHTERFTS